MVEIGNASEISIDMYRTLNTFLRSVAKDVIKILLCVE